MTEQTSIEDLQAEIAKLKADNEKLTTDFNALQSENKTNTDNLAKSRELNAKLLLQVPVPNNENPEPEEDTIDSVVDDIVTSVNKKYMERYTNGY